MSEEEKVRQEIREAFKQGYKASQKDIPLEKILKNLKGAQA